MKTEMISNRLPENLKKKKKMRIREAKSFCKERRKIKKRRKVVLDMINGNKVYFALPGKDLKKHYYDMSPVIENKFEDYPFEKIWDDMVNISIILGDDLFKKVLVILYRMAYLIDYDIVDGLVRFNPNDEIKNTIFMVQKEIDKNKLDYNFEEMLTFIDLLSWNEDMRYNYKKIKKKRGRVKCIYGIMRVTATYRDFYLSIVNGKKIDIRPLYELTQAFVRGHGMVDWKEDDLFNYLSQYLIK